jgi:plasmid stability protein
LSFCCRTNIYLSEPQKKALDARAAKLGISVAEVIRRILDEALAKEKP